ncbi:MAG: VCBS repeat-containing protein, partial [Planctomycetaceae bacterium]
MPLQERSRCCRAAGAFFVETWLFVAAGCGGVEPPTQPATSPPAAPWLIESTQSFGLEFVHQAGEPLRYEMPQIMGSGCGLLDFDGDGRLDLYLVDGEASQRGGRRDGLFRRGNDQTFVEATDAAGIRNDGYGMGVAVADFDNDGFSDLYVSSYGPDQLFRNNGDGTFADVTETAGIVAPGWGTAVCFSDYDRDGLLDLFVVHYVDYLPGQYCEDRSGRRDFCAPGVYLGTADRLYRNEGDGRFVDVTSAVGLDVDLGKGLGVACDDFNTDGRPDFYVANDMEENHLWIQQPDGTFRNEAILRGAAVSAMGESQAGMGVVSADLTNDGRRDLFLTHLRGETNTLYVSSEGGFFTDGTANSGLGPNSRPATGFGVAAVDLRHDGRLDVLVANGRVLRGPRVPGANSE